MSNEAMSKGIVVAALLGALGLVVGLAVVAQNADQAAETKVAGDVAEEDKREIRQTIRKAIMAHRQLDFETAEKLLVKLSERYPHVAAVWLNLGICYRSLDKLDAADRAFARVLEIDAQDWDAIAERATIRVQKGQVDKAFEMVAQVPAYKGQMQERLRADEIWIGVRDDERMKPLMLKHGVVTDGDTSVVHTKRILKNEREKAAAANKQAAPAAASDDKKSSKE